MTPSRIAMLAGVYTFLTIAERSYLGPNDGRINGL
jgi:hypothetical protein